MLIFQYLIVEKLPILNRSKVSKGELSKSLFLFTTLKNKTLERSVKKVWIFLRNFMLYWPDKYDLHFKKEYDLIA